MKKKTLQSVLISVMVSLLLEGFIFIDKGPNSSKTNVQQTVSEQAQNIRLFTDNTVVYTDNMDGANDTNALKARGYKPYYRGTGPQGQTGQTPTWYQGNATIFPAFNGPATGYVAANYLVVRDSNNIDSWLVFPRITGGIIAGDSLYFYSRSPQGSIYPDSIRVMYSVSDSIPEGSWTELGRFKVNTLNMWELIGFRAPTTSVNGRFCIRYAVVNGGPLGLNSDYIGIDAANIVRTPSGIHGNQNEIPSAYILEQNYPNPFNPSTVISYQLPVNGFVTLVVYDILGNEVKTLVNGTQTAGVHELQFDASSLSNGIYLYRIFAGSFTDAKKMVLVK